MGYWIFITVSLAVDWLFSGLVTDDVNLRWFLFAALTCFVGSVAIMAKDSNERRYGNDRPTKAQPLRKTELKKSIDLSTTAAPTSAAPIPAPTSAYSFHEESIDIATCKSHQGPIPETISINTIDTPVPETPSKRGSNRKKTRIFDPSHYSRHTGVPGFLYIARNDFHQLGLFKMGYVTGATPDKRIKSLNDQHSRASDIGSFKLVHASPVSGCFDAEQALFDLIAKIGIDENNAEIRVVGKREYFFERTDFLIRAVQAASAFNNKNPEALDDFLDWALEQDSWSQFRPAYCRPVTVPPKLHSTDGWVYVVRNMWHRDLIFRVGVSKHNPLKNLAILNSKQRDLTCQIGFYTLVHCVVVNDLQQVGAILMPLIAPHKVAGSRVFYETTLGKLTEAISASLHPAQKEDRTASLQLFDQISVEVVRSKAHPSWAPWASNCPTCHQLLRFRGAISTTAIVICPSCECGIECHIGSAKVTIN